jgi:hypothetical protein
MAAAYYYIDNTNGLDAHTGLRIPAGDITSVSYNTVDSTADTTHFVDAALTGANDYINGSFFWNVTRGAGSLITDFVAADDTVTLGTAVVGMTAGDEYYILDSWKTIPQYTSVSARTAGDKAYVRANQTHTLAAILGIDEDGTADLRISLIGCNATQGIDPYHDASDVRPIITCAGQAYYLSLYTDDYWYIANLDIIGGTGQYLPTTYLAGAFGVKYGTGNYIYNCIFRDSSGATSANVLIMGECYTTFDSCAFTNGKSTNVILYQAISDTGSSDAPMSCSNIVFKNCTFNSGANSTPYGISVVCAATIFLDNCNFGGVATHATADIRIAPTFIRAAPLMIYCRNTIFNSTKLSWGITGYDVQGIKIFEEDTQQVFGDSLATYYYGTIQKSSTARDGGATSSAQMIPVTGVGLYNPLSITNDFIPDFRVWLAAGEHTVTVYIRGVNWAAYPTAAQLYLEAEYVTSDTTNAITRAKVVSTEVLTDNTTWVGLACAVNLHVASFVNLKVNLCLYEDATTGVLVDIKPVIS